MSFAARLTRCPIPFDADAGAEARALFPDLAPELGDLIAGTAGCSPYLKGLMAKERDWIGAALDGTPEAALDAALIDLPEVALADLGSALRQAKRRVALLAGLADLGGVWPLEAVTGALTRLADLSVDLSLKRLVAEEIRRGKVPGAVPEDAGTAAGMVALAMGKMGAGELNYSSDIDLICLYDETRFDDPSDAQEARAAFIRVTRKMTALLSDLTAEGYVFRTDLRLRPDASVTPVCLSMAAAESYYESVGRTWERAAYIKARPCAGDLVAGARFLKTLTPFVWRKHLDFTAIQDAHDMRLRIREHKRLHGPIVLEGHNMKLGRGGIREIEFFTQTRQLIAGGRDPELRSRETVPGLAALAAKGWVPEAVAEELTDHYRAHREVEHRCQMVQDAQTHLLPNSPEGIERIARMCGEGDTARFRARLTERLERVDGLTEGFFAPDEAGEAEESAETREITDGWANYPALRSDRAVQIFRRLRPTLIEKLNRAAHPNEALRAFDGFLAGLPAGVQLFSLFEANPSLIDLILDICATSPQLGVYLSRNAQVLDAVLGGGFFAPWPGVAALRSELAARLEAIPDYEGKLDDARRWAKEWHFRVGVHHLRGLIDAVEAGKHYADLAEAVVAAIWTPCVDEFARKHGMPPGRGAVVLGMGSLGAGRLNATSDLDLIVIYDPEDAEASEGPRPLAVRPYYARLTQALVTALTAPMAEGRLYEVDMRLRPSGRQGPVATSWPAFQAYQQDEAWTWEHLALTRARAIAGEDSLAWDVEGFRRALLRRKGKGESVLRDVVEMRARLRAAKPGQGAWEAKFGPGRMMEIELVAQTGALLDGSAARRVEVQIQAGRRAGLLDAAAEETLLAAYRLCWRLTAAHRLLTDRVLDFDALGAGGTAFVLRETGAASVSDLAATLAERTAAADAAITALLPEVGDDG